jgi:protein-S-isoprenylcysteine O-methyltransferase Ste14
MRRGGIVIYIAIGTIGFIVIHLFDIVSLKRIPGAKLFTWVLGSGLLAYALTMVCLQSDKLPLPVWSTWLGWVLLSISLFLLIYSLFINLPFRKTYVTTGVGNKLITTGLYALVRHPGVHWFILFVLSLILVSKSSLLLIAAPIWIFLDILLVLIEDKFVFTRIFDGYESYRKQTPMLLPNRKSISACVRTLNQARF